MQAGCGKKTFTGTEGPGRADPGRLSVCMLVPAYNESKTVADVVKGCRTYVPDVLVVDDGSRDDTTAIARDAGASVITHETNRGKGAALKTGFEHIIKGGWDALIVIDADGQHDWHEIPAIIDATLRENAAMTIGSRMSDVKTMPVHRRISNWLTSRIISSLSGQYVPDSQCGFRLIRTSMLKELEMSTDNFEMESEMIILAGRMGYRVSSVPIRTIYIEGRERIGPGRDTLRFIKLFASHLLGLR